MNWRERLIAAETQRSENSAYWARMVPALLREHLAPAAEEFCKVVGAHVTARSQVLPAENKVVLSFDDWHLGEWTMTVQLQLSSQEDAHVEIVCSGSPPIRRTILRDLPNPTETFLEWMTDAYVTRVGPV